MASKPGILTDWPWTCLGSFKYVILAPWVAQSIYSYMTKDENERDFTNFMIFPFLLTRMLHNQIWISLSRYRTAKGNNRIVDKSIEFEQVDRERNWFQSFLIYFLFFLPFLQLNKLTEKETCFEFVRDDQILFNGALFYLANLTLKGAQKIPIWRTDGVIITILLHAGAVEFLYYWLHRALHHHFLYSRYHSHHHSSIVTEPITSVIHPFAEHIAYFALFAIPMMTLVFTGTSCLVGLVGYITYIDFMNNLGHCNFELVPKSFFNLLPPLKYLVYTPSYHSLHHTQFRTNYALFMPFYDYIYGTADKFSDELYETSLQRQEESPDVVHLTHLTTPESIYHIRLGFAFLASNPQRSDSKWYFQLMRPITLWSMAVTWFYGKKSFVVERNVLNNLKLQTWAIPKYSTQYLMQSQSTAINNMIEEAILEADKKGVKVLSLGLHNQGEELNGNGELFVRKNPKLNVKLVDGSSLAIGVVLNSIPKGTTQVVFTGNLTNIAYSIALALCQRGIQVVTLHKEEHMMLKGKLESEAQSNLVLEKSCDHKIWLVGDGLSEEEQMRAPKGTLFLPISQFPPKKIRRDCFYYTTPAMVAPKYLENLDSCENWLPRRVMSAWRIAGIVHGLEGWDDDDECGIHHDIIITKIDRIWRAALLHGFLPIYTPTN